MPPAELRQPRFVQLHHADPAGLRQDLLAGLQAPAARIAPKYFYDALGSRLFDAITELSEYYPTRTEAALLAAHGPAIAACLPRGATLVDLGAGNCEKAGRLFGLLQPARYVAVDISVEHLQHALSCLQRQYPELDLLGVGLDFSSRLVLPPEVGEGPRLLFYPGSSIGNFTPEAALAFLRQVRAVALGGGLLIGVDLVKPLDVLQSAYDDALGVTAAFNRNVLLHLNRLLDSDFAVQDWRHVAFFQETESRIEMHLEARHALTVRWPGGERRFARGERIHTEHSYKYRLADFQSLLAAAGFAQVQAWTDERGWFAMYWAQA
jgi:L-histidine N-alpha-methyltransferase